jgi:TetR/AcrR family transcriptional regulator, transcriptional repressor of bet genes
MPKIVDHAERRSEIAHAACKVVAQHGFDRATVVRIARAAGFTSGMVAHYFETKQDIVLAALRLILLRIEQRLTQSTHRHAGLLAVLSEALPVDEQRFIECAFWTAFWGQVAADPRAKRLNAWVHREYARVFERCIAKHWSEWGRLPKGVRGKALRSLMTFINGLTASAVTSRADWPARTQVEQLGLHLSILHNWARARQRRGM